MLTRLLHAVRLIVRGCKKMIPAVEDAPYSSAGMVPAGALAKPVFLMCAPTLYDVNYVINPWMEGNVHGSSREHAMGQWQSLHHAVSQVAEVELIEPQPGSPDMVFTANAGLERDGVVVLSSFFHVQRQGEEAHFRKWFNAAGYKVVSLPRAIAFEGEGDALFSVDGSTLWIGYGPRTSLASHELLRKIWLVEIVSLRLIDPHFYHLDTCFVPLGGGAVMYYPGAFDDDSLRKIEAFYPEAKRIVVDESDALRFACNVVPIGVTLILNKISSRLALELESRGFTVLQVELGEFMKAGGAAKCLVMKLTHAA